MKHSLRFAVATVMLLALAGCASPDKTTSLAAPAAAPHTNSIQMARQFKLTEKRTLAAKYLLFLPQGYSANSKTTWPLILFLHGAGERGDDIWLAAKHGPPKEVTEHPDFPFILVTPQCPQDQVWSDDVLMALLDEVIANCRVDTNRVYLTGLSMGGYATWNLGLRHPERFAAIAPVCGGGDVLPLVLAKGRKLEALQSLGVWAFHGAKDPVVPVQESQRMIEVLKRYGATDLKLTIYPEAQHDAWTETYQNPELYKWFLHHRRHS